MENKQNTFISIDSPKNGYELFLQSIEVKLKKQYPEIIELTSKVLYDTTKLHFLFNLFLFAETDLNPLDDPIEFNIEFIENENPYIQIITNLFEPTLYDLRNYYYCLCPKSNIFKENDFQNNYLHQLAFHWSLSLIMNSYLVEIMDL